MTHLEHTHLDTLYQLFINELNECTQYNTYLSIGCVFFSKVSRKIRYPEEYGWNLQNMVTILLTHIRERHTEQSAKVRHALKYESSRHRLTLVPLSSPLRRISP